MFKSAKQNLTNSTYVNTPLPCQQRQTSLLLNTKPVILNTSTQQPQQTTNDPNKQLTSQQQ